MTGKANAVFWIGLILIILNFWVSGQSTTFWSIITGGAPTILPAPKPAPPVKDPRKKGPDPHGTVQ